jgi:hypothetical protein
MFLVASDGMIKSNFSSLALICDRLMKRTRLGNEIFLENLKLMLKEQPKTSMVDQIFCGKAEGRARKLAVDVIWFSFNVLNFRLTNKLRMHTMTQ